MAYRAIPATRIHPVPGKNDLKACPRCGVERRTDGGGRRHKNGLCRDCISALGAEERREWAA